jgi:hypothetical protein
VEKTYKKEDTQEKENGKTNKSARDDSNNIPS